MIKPKILIVEDNKTLADSIGAACELDSMEPLVVYNGEDALAAFHEHKELSFVVLDILLPDISGFDICRRIREKSKVPILFMTSRTALPDEISGLEMGADGYLKKPVSPRAVVSHIRATLRRANEWSKQEKSPEEENEKDSDKDAKNQYTPYPDFKINEEAKAIYFLGILLDLTLFEYLILSEMIRHPGRIYSFDQLISLLDEDVIVTRNSIYNIILHIRQKLEQIKPGVTIIESCRGFGYKVIAPE